MLTGELKPGLDQVSAVGGRQVDETLEVLFHLRYLLGTPQ